MRKCFVLVVSTLALVACDDDDHDPRVDALLTRIAELETQVSALKARLSAAETKAGANETALADASPILTAAEELLALVKVESGDVVVEGANLRVRWADVPGKGNVIIGNDEVRSECVDGPHAGEGCLSIDQCPSATACEPVADPQKNGHHNLVIGIGHRYHGVGSIVAGELSTVGSVAAILSGQDNSAGDSTAIVGGYENQAVEIGSVILGGEDQTTTTQFETIPPIN